MKYLGILLIFVCSILTWFGFNSQLIERVSKHGLLIAVTLSIPCTLSYFYAYKILYAEMNSVWSIKFISFSISMFVFATMTWYFLGETPFNPKTMACLTLALIVLIIQML